MTQETYRSSIFHLPGRWAPLKPVETEYSSPRFHSLFLGWAQILRCGTELLKVLAGQDAPPVLWIHFRGLRDVASCVITFPHSFHHLQDMELTMGTAPMRLQPKKIKQARNQGTIFPKIKKQIKWLCCIITVCSLYKELQILFYISIYRKLYNEPQFYLKDVEFFVISIHISVENTHSLKLPFSLKKKY